MDRLAMVLVMTLLAALCGPESAALAQSDGSGDDAQLINRHWWGKIDPRWRFVRPTTLQLQAVGEIEVPDEVLANKKKNFELGIGIEEAFLSGHPFFYAMIPRQFSHGGDAVDLDRADHRVELHWEVDGVPIVTAREGIRSGNFIKVGAQDLERDGFASLLSSLKRGRKAVLWVWVDGRARFSYEISLIGFSAAWTHMMGDWSR